MESKVKIQDKIIDKTYELKLQDTATLTDVLGIIFLKFGYEFDKEYLAFLHRGIEIAHSTTIRELYDTHHYTINGKVVLAPKLLTNREPN